MLNLEQTADVNSRRGDSATGALARAAKVLGRKDVTAVVVALIALRMRRSAARSETWLESLARAVAIAALNYFRRELLTGGSATNQRGGER